MAAPFIHPSALVEEDVEIGDRTKVWHWVHLRRGARVGSDCVIGRGVFVDVGVHLGRAVKVQNNVSIYHGVTVEEGVFLGPHVCFTNDLYPRAIKRDGTPKGFEDWVVARTLVRRGASIGANATVVCGVTIGEWALVGAGSVVTRDVADHALVVGTPARQIGYVCTCGRRVATLEVARTGEGCTCS